MLEILLRLINRSIRFNNYNSNNESQFQLKIINYKVFNNLVHQHNNNNNLRNNVLQVNR